MRSFKTKIPTHLHEKIYEWYSTTMSKVAILSKLEKEHGYHTHERTLDRLLSHMKTEKQAITSAVIAQKTQEQVVGDFDKLNKLYQEVEGVAKMAIGNDHNLHLRAVDRLVKLLQIKFSITTKDNTTSEFSEDEILQGLIDKLGK